MQCCSFWGQHYDIAINYVGDAESWESVEIDSSLGTRDCPVPYKREGRTIAFATISRDLQSLEVEAAMKTRKAKNGIFATGGQFNERCQRERSV